MNSDKGYIHEMADDSIRKINVIVSESKRFLDALGEIAVAGDQANAVYLRGIARAAIDGASTTADDYNRGKEFLESQGVKWVSPNDPGDENDRVCKHNVPRNVQCPICAGSEDRWHDTNAQVVAYDKSMEEE